MAPPVEPQPLTLLRISGDLGHSALCPVPEHITQDAATLPLRTVAGAQWQSWSYAWHHKQGKEVAHIGCSITPMTWSSTDHLGVRAALTLASLHIFSAGFCLQRDT